LQNNGVKYGQLSYYVYTEDGKTVIEKWSYSDDRELSYGKYEKLSFTNNNGDIVIDLFPTCIVDSVKLNNLDTLDDTLKVHYYAMNTNSVAIVVNPNNPHKLNHEFNYNEYGYYSTMYLTDTSNRNLGTIEMRNGQWKINLTSGAVNTVSFDRTNGVLTITTK
jgi:hypothetical protein